MSFKSGALGIVSLLSISIVQAHSVWLELTKNTNECVVKLGFETTKSYSENKTSIYSITTKEWRPFFYKTSV